MPKCGKREPVRWALAEYRAAPRTCLGKSVHAFGEEEPVDILAWELYQVVSGQLEMSTPSFA